jgi:membrane protease YdiL (CAAX protease family)
MGPTDLKNSLPLILALTVVLLVVVAIDIILFIRWLVYRLREEAWFRTAPNTLTGPAETVVSEATVTTPLLGAPVEEETLGTPVEEATAVEAEMPALQSLRLRPYSPFALQWSLVDPFIGFQVVLILANLFPLIAFFAYLLLTGAFFSPAAVTPASERAMPYVIMFGLGLQNVFFVGVAAFYLRRYGTSLREVGLRRPTARLIVLGLGMGLLLCVVAQGAEIGFVKALQHILPRGSVEHLQKLSEPFDAEAMFLQLRAAWLKILFILLGAIAAPIGEEVFFRGFLYNVLKHRFGVTVGIVVSGLAFALIHISPLAVVIIFPMGMILAYTYERTRSLWVTICMHAVNNGLAFILAWIHQTR